MGATPDYNKPLWANPIDTDIDQIRDNFMFLMCQVATGIPILPGWFTLVDVATNSNYAKPDGYVLSHPDGRKIYVNLTWSGTPVRGSLISSITLCYDDGVSSGKVCFDPVTTGSPFITTAKRFDNPSTNYYRGGVGNMFPSTGGEVGVTRILSFYPLQNVSSTQMVDCSRSAEFLIGYINGGGGIGLRAWVGVDTYFNVGPTAASSHPPVTLNAWHSVGIAFNFSTGIVKYVYDGVYSASYYTENVTAGSVVRDYSGQQEYIGSGSAHNTGDFSNCYISQYWMDDSYIDLSVASTWAKFFDGDNKPIYLGANGELPTGSQPLHFTPNGDMTNNLGSQANWIEVGTVPDAPSSPTD